LKKLKDEARGDVEYEKECIIKDFIKPYIAKPARTVIQETNHFKKFMLLRRLTDFGISWKKAVTVLLNIGHYMKLRQLGRSGVPHKIKSVLRHSIIVEEYS
jgi:hypothetical protein